MPVVSPDTAAEEDIDFASPEQTNLVAGAQIIVSPEFIAADLVSQEANPLFQLLPAVQRGGYVPLSREEAQALYIESSLSYRRVIPRLVDAVIAGAKGEGKRLEE
jgi:hypothetical protein